MTELQGQYLTFGLNNQNYGVPISFVREINRMTDITAVPNTPEFVKGVINLRGKVIPIVDLRLKFNLEATDYTKVTCIVVIEGEGGQVGAIVDSVQSVVNFDVSEVEPPPQLGSPETTSFVIGMAKQQSQVTILVDIMKCLSKEELKEFINFSDLPTSDAA